MESHGQDGLSWADWKGGLVFATFVAAAKVFSLPILCNGTCWDRSCICSTEAWGHFVLWWGGVDSSRKEALLIDSECFPALNHNVG